MDVGGQGKLDATLLPAIPGRIAQHSAAGTSARACFAWPDEKMDQGWSWIRDFLCLLLESSSRPEGLIVLRVTSHIANS